MRLFIAIIFLSFAAFGQGGFDASLAGRWRGTLEYKDYTSNERVTMPVLIRIDASGAGRLAVTTFYDDFGKVYRDAEEWKLDGARFLEGASEFAVAESAPGRLVVTGSAQDGNTVEPVRKTLTWDAGTLTILKETRTPWSFRHVYTLRRSDETDAAPVVLAPERMRADLDALRRALGAIHPGIDRYIAPAELDREFAATEASLGEPATEPRFYAAVAKLLAKIRCGHTYQNPLNQDPAVRARLFGGRTLLPFYFRIVDGRIFVTHNASPKKLAAGTEILSINGVAVAEIIAKLAAAVASDGNGTDGHRIASLELARADAERFAQFDILFPLFYPLDGPVLKFEAKTPGSDKVVTFETLALTKSERTAEMASRYGPAPDFDDQLKFEVRDGRYGWLTIPHSLSWRLKRTKIEKFYAEAFAAFRAAGVRELVVDLRGNGGGSEDVGFELARYLATKPLPPYAAGMRLVREVGPRPEIAKLVDTYSDELMNGLRDGLPEKRRMRYDARYFRILGREDYPAVKPREDAFRGRVFIIADAAAASATYQFLDYVKTNNLATIVGQPGGGNLQGINGGNYFFFRMPNSRIEVDIPAYFQTAGGNRPDSPVVPDVIVTRTPAAVASGEDEEFAAIRRLIR